MSHKKREGVELQKVATRALLGQAEGREYQEREARRRASS
jgi:hypothetical protein